MFSRSENVSGPAAASDSGTTGSSAAYPTQWAFNPSAYNGMDASSVDWAALAQRWIQMKESTPLAPVPPAPPLPDIATAAVAPEDTSVAMDLEDQDAPPAPSMSAAQWAGTGAAPAGWGGGSSWSQWGWGWGGAGDAKTDNIPAVPMMNYPSTEAPPISGYTTAAMPAGGYETGYWTAPVEAQPAAPAVTTRKSYETKSSSRNRHSRDRPSSHHTATSGSVAPPVASAPALDAAKRKQLPAWIREGLEKMEREKARMAEREALEEEASRRAGEEAELERIRAAADPAAPAKSKFDSDSEEGDAREEAAARVDHSPSPSTSPTRPASPPQAQTSREDLVQDMMLVVRRTLTEILLEVTDQEIRTVSQEELTRYTSSKASRLNAVGKSKALSAIASGLGLAAYGSSSGDSDSEDEPDGVADITDAQLQEVIRRRRLEFEKTARELEAEDIGNGEKHNHSNTPNHSPPTNNHQPDERNSTTPPPINREASEKLTPEKPASRDRKEVKRREDRSDNKRLETINEKPKKLKNNRSHTPNNRKSHTPSKDSKSSSSSDSSEDSSTNSDSSTTSSSASEKERRRNKRKRETSSDSESRRRASRKHRKEKKPSRNSVYKNRDGRSSRKDKESDDSSHSKRKSSKSSRRDYDDYYEKKHKRERESTRRRHDDNYERSRRHERDSRKQRDREDDRWHHRRRGVRSRSPTYEGSERHRR